MLKKLKAIARRARKMIISLKPFPYLVKTELNGKYNISHVSAFNYGNAGDILLPVVLRDLFNKCSAPKSWAGIHVSKSVDCKQIHKINSNDALVIGGGGLFLKDTNANNTSGWQWNCSVEAIKSIDKPIIMFAVGYNRFRGQSDFEPCFTDNINAFVEKASFVGLRNHGSIRKIKEYLKTDELKQKIVFQPCMTTLISRIYPNYTNFRDKEDFIAINCAFDRSELRSFDEKALRNIAQAAFELSKVTKLKYFSHMRTDCNILKYFDELNFDYELIEFNKVDDMVKAYSKPRLVIGMRGHAQMIPFGCQTPILSIISHDKMQWFLDDIHHSDWGVEILDPNFKELLLSRALDAYNNYQNRQADIIHEQSLLWDITTKNIEQINKIIQ